MLPLEPLEENSDIEISNFNLKATAKKDYFKTLGGVRINLQHLEKKTFELKKDPQGRKKLKQKKIKKERAENEMKKNYQWAFVTKDDCLISYQALFRVSDTCHVKSENKENILLSKVLFRPYRGGYDRPYGYGTLSFLQLLNIFFLCKNN